ncbi:activating signal cointegrator 1 complex subunit 2 [Pararge aegeria]|uniref:Jg22412 protein n=4 Tax=Pararge aegeria TaxID=116150 RepID=A0A8S4RQB2_9NEOP|nr:activating signal cointegrator 1 complex subunit 2 [Pararge aegeria]CAH2238345.1 jg22412 [Pararge aegeria aegeria]
MSNTSLVFSNPENLPVENVTISISNTGVLRQIKALDPYWLEKRDLILYERPPSGCELVLGALDSWKTKMEVYIGNLKWLLGLEHYRFWSTVLYHPQCMDSLISFIQEASPPYIPPHESKEVQKLYDEIRRLVLVVFSRLVTNKESKSQWMTKEHMAKIIYDKFIFTIPVLWDICVIYGADNSRHVSRLMDAVFSLQPRYETDAMQALMFVQESFKYIIMQVNKDYESAEPPNLPETFKGFGEIKRPSGSKVQNKITFDILKDLVIHMLDTAITLRIFAEVYPKSVDMMKRTNFVLSIVQLYEYGIPLLYEKLLEVADETSVTYTEVEGYIDLARAEFIDILREMLAVYKSAILNRDGSISSNVEAYLSVMLDALSERLLIKDYQMCYPVHEDLELLRQAYPDIDSVKTDFILQAIYSNIDEDDIKPEGIQTTDKLTNGHVETIDNGPTTSKDNDIPDKIREQSLISEVKDILPHLGDGFILKCLQHYGFSSERVINAVLEDTLADSLRGLDRNLPIIPDDILDEKFLETGIARLNVFDGDEFDIMTRDDVDVSRIHVGKKKEKYKSLGAMLDDKTVVKNRLDIYSKYNLVCDEESMYSDEYDDTYDSDGVAPTADVTDDPRRPFVTPRALQQRQRGAEEESEEETEAVEEEKAREGARNMDFCRNPEEMRARREANMAAKRGKGFRPQPPRNADVVGKQKGQGQEKEVLQNRDKKEKHKSARGNHNRRQGAQWKRSQGMMPS